MPRRTRFGLICRASRRLVGVGLALLAIAPATASAQTAGTSAANAVFEAVSRSVVSVHVFEGKPGARKRISLGSAVAIAPSRIVTNCHVIAPGLSSTTHARELPIEVKVAGSRGLRPRRAAGSAG
jgi:S1-C subfamily serine protease